MLIRSALIFIFLFSTNLFAEKNEITIGALLPLSGSMHSLGEGSRKGLELAVNNINSKGVLQVKC